jgi:hypothetical protein
MEVAFSARVMANACSESQEKDVQALAGNEGYRLVRLVCWSLFIGFALIDTWSGRQFTQSDGISYIDMSDALSQHNWHLLINPLWSPLYPTLIGVATWLAHPSAHWEVPIAHIVNFVIFLGALASFEFLLHQVICVLGRDHGRLEADEVAPLPAWRWQLLGYCIFAWSTFVVISLRIVTPDLCVSMFVYLDAGLLLRLRSGTKMLPTCLLLGLTLGLGYFAKAVLFPMAFVFMAVAFLVVGVGRKAILPLAMTLLVFSAISAPLFIAMSREVGRPSFSESGNLNYAWHVNGKNTQPFHFSSPPSYLEHPMNIFHRRPDVFGFRNSMASTYSPYFDAQYWNAGLKREFSLSEQLRAIRGSLAVFCAFPLVSMWLVIGGLLVLFFMNPDVPRRLQRVLMSWPLLIPGVAGITIYLLVSVEPRYVAPFILLVFVGLFPAMLFQKSADVSSRNAIATLILAATVMVLTAFFVVHRARMPVLRDYGGAHDRAAESLSGAGIQPGEAVGIIGSGSDEMIWARLARARIVAQILPDDASDFWQTPDPQAKDEVYAAFSRAGAKAIVSDETPPSVGFADWQKAGDSSYYVHFLTLPESNKIETPTQ